MTEPYLGWLDHSWTQIRLIAETVYCEHPMGDIPDAFPFVGWLRRINREHDAPTREPFFLRERD